MNFSPRQIPFPNAARVHTERKLEMKPRDPVERGRCEIL